MTNQPQPTPQVTEEDREKAGDFRAIELFGFLLFLSTSEKADLDQRLALFRAAARQEGVMTQERMLDLIRHQRHALYETRLISDREYADLINIEGAPQRLMSYDEAIREASRDGVRMMAEALSRLVVERAHSGRAGTQEMEALLEARDLAFSLAPPKPDVGGER